MSLRTAGLATVFGSLICVSLLAFSQCSQLGVGAEDADAQIRAKKVQYALAVLKSIKPDNESSTCVSALMRYLGEVRAEEAIPILTKLITYKATISHPQKLLTSGDIYPAIGALLGIGEAAVPSMVAVIAAEQEDSTASQNALDVIMTMYGEHPKDGMQTLLKAADSQSDGVASYRLHAAAETYKSKLCPGKRCS
jgi:hypothetical protein